MRKEYWIWLLMAAVVVFDYFVDTDVTGGDPNVKGAWIGAAISAVAAIGSSIAGAVAANKRKKEAESQVNKKDRKLRDWRDAEMNTDYLDRADSRAAMRRVMEYNREAQKSTDTAATKRGMTDEARVAQAARLNKNYADVVSQIAGAGARHKDSVQQMYLRNSMDLDNMKIQNLMDTSGINNMVQGVTGAASALGGADWGKGGGKTAKGVANAAAPQFSSPQHINLQNTQGIGNAAWAKSNFPSPYADRSTPTYRPK